MATRVELTEKIQEAKRRLGLSWKAIAAELVSCSPILYTAALLGEFPLKVDEANKAAALLGLDDDEAKLLTESPERGATAMMPPTDPLMA
jgi:cyanate lyase